MSEEAGAGNVAIFMMWSLLRMPSYPRNVGKKKRQDLPLTYARSPSNPTERAAQAPRPHHCLKKPAWLPPEAYGPVTAISRFKAPTLAPS